MPTVFPSASNVFIADHDASNNLVVDFARNPTKFPVLNYTQTVKVPKTIGYYLLMTVEECGRILQTDLANLMWPDGDARPDGNNGAESFNFLPFRCERYTDVVAFGELTVEQCTWDVIQQHVEIKSKKMMTARTQLAVAALTSTSDHLASHQLDVTAISGNTGNLVQSTTARQDIKRTLHTAVELILDDTMGNIDVNDLGLVINSSLAAKLARCQEIVDYVKGSPDAMAMIRGELADPTGNAMYGLPPKLYGVNLWIEKTRKVTSKKGAATVARSQVMPESTPVLCARPGSLLGPANSPNFSSVVGFFKEEMTVEKFADLPKNRRTLVGVTENYCYKLVAPASAVLFTNASS